MGRYGFTSVGGDATNAIQKFLVQRAMQQRQQDLDVRARAEEARQAEQQAADLKLRQEQETRVAAAQKTAQADAERERTFRRASNIATTGVPGIIDQDTAGLLKGEGFGGLVNEGPVSQGAFQGNDDNEIPQYAVSPGILQFAGGSQYQNARAAEQARAEAATAAQAAAKERADADRAGREEIARLGAGARSETAGLRNDLLETQIAAAKQKQTDADAAKVKSEGDAASVTRSAITQLERLKTHPGLAKASGAYEMRGFTQDAQNFNAIREQVINSLALPNLGALKGPMSDKDIAFVKNISTRLDNHNIDEAETVKAIDEAITFLNGKIGGGGSNTHHTGEKKTFPNGRTATWDGTGWAAD